MRRKNIVFNWLLALAWLGCLSTLQAQKAGEDASGAGNLMATDAFELLFPLGKPWTHVRVPKFDGEDKLQSILLAETLTRYDQQLLRMDDMTIVMVGDDGTTDMRVKTDVGIYDLETEKLKSRTRTFIQHQKFDMWGDTMEFNTKTQHGKLNGNVEMIIFEIEGAAMPMPGLISTPTPAPPEGEKPETAEAEAGAAEANANAAEPATKETEEKKP